MAIDPDKILSVLDRCCDAFTFPMLDNGYFYLAATRLTLYRTQVDWAIVIEEFGFSPRAGFPDTNIQTFASRLNNRDPQEQYVSQKAYDNYVANNPHNESQLVYPIEEGSWCNAEDAEVVAENAKHVIVRGQQIPLPPLDEYTRFGIEIEQAPRIQVFELCRFLAGAARDQVLATPQERRTSVIPDLTQILQLEEWHHPNVVDDNDRPSGSETFKQLARVLACGDVGLYRPTQPPNTHWSNWPEGGTL